MSYGIPYAGSKNIYARKICEALPSGNRLVDLFAGGCAVSDCAIKTTNKWNKFYINDISENPINLYKKCLEGSFIPNYRWVSRDEFKASEDWETRLIWSYGCGCKNYVFSKHIECYKQDIWNYVVFNKTDFKCSLFNEFIPKDNLTRDERYNIISQYLKNKKDVNINGYIKHIDSLERLVPYTNIKRLLSLKKDSDKFIEFTNYDYKQYKYIDGDVVYCDIPYLDTETSQYEKKFDHNEFWEWAKSQQFDVYVSERTIPNNSVIIFEQTVQNRYCSKITNSFKTEYLIKV